DHLGSSSYISNAAGTVSQHMEYLPFGELLVDEHTNSYNSPFKYNGKEFDEETGNYYYGARYYDPRTSIWLSVDPLAEKYPSWNPYAYTFQNPINFIEPDGREGRAVNDNIIVTVSNTTNNSRGEIRRDVSLSMTLTIVKGKNDDLSKTMFNKSSGSVNLSNFQGEAQSFIGGHKAYDNVTNVNINYKVVESIDKVGKDDHVMLLVDSIPKLFGEKALDP